MVPRAPPGAGADVARLGLPPRARILDAGCGSGRNMVDLARWGAVTGVELSAAAAEAARGRHVGEVVEGSVLEMPFSEDSFDLAVCLDVIEHLQDDRAALRELRRVLAPGGALLVTVPAYQWLWSGHDEVNHHHRRYSRATLRRAAREAGWECERTTHFNSLLLPVAIALRALDRLHARATESSLDLWVPPAPLNWLLQQPLHLEAAADRPRRHDPCGPLAAGGAAVATAAAGHGGPAHTLRGWRTHTRGRPPATSPPAVRSGPQVAGRVYRAVSAAGCMRKVHARFATNVHTVTDRRRAHLPDELVQARVVHEHVHQGLVHREAAALHHEPPHRRQRVAHVLAERPAAVPQEAVDGPHGERRSPRPPGTPPRTPSAAPRTPRGSAACSRCPRAQTSRTAPPPGC